MSLRIFSSNSFFCKKHLGSGAYGEVYIATSEKFPNKTFAIKRNIVESSVTSFGNLKELDFLCRFSNHELFVPFFGIVYENPFLNSVMMRTNKDMRIDDMSFVFEAGAYDCHILIYDGKTSTDYLKQTMVQMLLAVEYLHSKGVIHRDIKPSNFLWFRDGNRRLCRICDFGLSKNSGMESFEKGTLKLVTRCYGSPESSCSSPVHLPASDIWSLGCIFFEMFAKKPFIDTGRSDRDFVYFRRVLSYCTDEITSSLLERLNIKKYSPPLRISIEEHLHISDEIRSSFSSIPGSYQEYIQVLQSMLCADFRKRKSATEILEMPFFSYFSSYISSIRKTYPPVPDAVPFISFVNCPERKWANLVFLSFFEERNLIRWYRHRVLFLAIDLFFRYLSALEENQASFQSSLQSTGEKGKFMTYQEALFRATVCCNISGKYFATFDGSVEYTKFVTSKFTTSEFLREANLFEKFLVEKICFGRIYRKTIVEMIDVANVQADDNFIRDLLLWYTNKNRKYQKIDIFSLFSKFCPNANYSHSEPVNAREEKILQKKISSEKPISSYIPTTTRVRFSIPCESVRHQVYHTGEQTQRFFHIQK
jgi:serine/threonine protein kinase